MGETDVIFDLLFVKSDKKTSIKKTRHEKKIQYEKIKKENHKKFFKGRILKKIGVKVLLKVVKRWLDIFLIGHMSSSLFRNFRRRLTAKFITISAF